MGEIRSFGYIRVSTKEQNEARQIEALKGLDIQERDLYIDKQSGKDFDRPKYQALKLVLRKGDILFIKELDRLGRNAEEIKKEWKEITQEIGANIVILDMPILDTRQYKNGLEKVISTIVLELLSYMAEREKEKINSRQMEGIATAKASGVKFGRPKREISNEFIVVYEEWKTGSITAVEAMRRVDMKPNTFYRRTNEYEQEKASI
ncbi:recombinase family protein [Paenibacillus sp. FSL H8-0034]|uniref:recombinase family protein n=1 Tax=Paenibacillus sp. FSL H8-0034 TaxID=2954671 RepID=UPI0030F70F4A